MQTNENLKRRLSLNSGESSDISPNTELDTFGIMSMIRQRPIESSSSSELSTHQDASLHKNNSLQQNKSSQPQSNVKTNVSSSEPPNVACQSHHECHFAYTLIDEISYFRFAENAILQRLHLDVKIPIPAYERALRRCLSLMAILNTVTQARISFENMALSKHAFHGVMKSQFTYHINVMLISSLSAGWSKSSIHIVEIAKGFFSLTWIFDAPDSQCVEHSILDDIIEPEYIRTKYRSISDRIRVFLDESSDRKIMMSPATQAPLGWVHDLMDIMYAYFMLFDTSDDVLCGKCKKKLLARTAQESSDSH
jgi:hypothetical protein